MPTRNTIQIVINARDNASNTLRGVADNIQGIGSAALTIGGAGIAAASAAVTAFGVSSFNAFTDFQNGMNEVFTLLPGITAEAMGGMESEVQRFMNTTGRLSEETLPALYQSLSAGVPRDNVFEFMQTAHQAAMGGVTNLETAVDGISSVINAYGTDVLGATQASDLMFTAVRLGKTDFEQLSSSLFNVVPVAAAMGVGFQDITAGLATITAQGVPTSVATTQLRQLFVELGDTGTEVGQIFEEVAGQSFGSFIEEGGSTADALRLMEQAANEAGIPLNQMFGSIEAGQAALALTGANMETFANNTEAMADSAGATEAAYNQMANGIQNSLNLFRARFESAMVSTGRVIAPFVQPLIDVFGVLFAIFENGVSNGETLSDWLGHLPRFLRPLGDMVGRFGAFLFTASNAISEFFTNIENGVDSGYAFWLMLGQVFDPRITNTLAIMTFHIRTFAETIINTARPIVEWLGSFVEMQDVLVAFGIAIGAVIIPAVASFVAAIAVPLAIFGALIVAVAALRTAWEENFLGIRDIVNDAWVNYLQPAFEGIGNFFSGLVDAFQGGGLSGAATFVQDNLINPIVNSLTTAWDNIDWGAVPTNILNALGAAFNTAVSWATWIADNIGTPLINNAQAAWESIDWSAVGSGILNAIGSVLTTAVNFVEWFSTNVYIPMLNNAQAALDSIDWFSVGEGIINAIGSALTAAFDFVSWIVDSIFNPVTENADGAIEGIDWLGMGETFLNAIGSALIAAFDFVVWLSTNVFMPLVNGAASAIAGVDWAGVGTSIFSAIANALPNIVEWVTTNIITPVRNSLANFDPMSAINTAGQSANQLGQISGLVTSGQVSFGDVVGAFGRQFGFQFGGDTRAGDPIIVGDGGSPNSRELFIPKTDGTVVPNAQTEDILQSGGNGSPINIYFNFHHPITESDARSSASMLKNTLQAEGVRIGT